MDSELFGELITSCKEAIEYENGNISLKSTVVEVPDDEVVFYSKYRKLPENAKHAVHIILDEMLRVR